MICDETQELIHPYVDGELDVVHSLAVERHLHDCAICSQALRNLEELRAALQSRLLYYEAPPELRRRIRAALPPGKQRWSRWVALAAAVACLVLAVAGWGRWGKLSGPDDRLAEDIVSGHLRSLQAGHLYDVASTDQHTVKPWFNGRLDFSPSVRDLTSQGFPLQGGRLDFMQNRSVAALVYRRSAHVINVFTWPQEAGPVQDWTHQGYHVIHWARDGMTWWAVSDLNLPELRQFVSLMQN